MVNSSLLYFVNEDEVELATPYQLDDGKLRETAWVTNANTGPDCGPAGMYETVRVNRIVTIWCHMNVPGNQSGGLLVSHHIFRFPD